MRWRPPVHPLLDQRVPVKTAAVWDRQQVWNWQLDYVLHCGRSPAAQCALLCELYEAAADFRNFPQPAIELKEKVRVVGKVRLVSEAPRTLYRRFLKLGELKPK